MSLCLMWSFLQYLTDDALFIRALSEVTTARSVRFHYFYAKMLICQ